MQTNTNDHIVSIGRGVFFYICEGSGGVSYYLMVNKCNTGSPSTTRLNIEDFVAFKKSFGAYNRNNV